LQNKIRVRSISSKKRKFYPALANIIEAGLLLLIIKINLMGIWRQIAEYLYIKKRDPNNPRTQWMKYMHGMNRISIFMFLFGLIVLLVRFVIIPLFSK